MHECFAGYLLQVDLEPCRVHYIGIPGARGHLPVGRFVVVYGVARRIGAARRTRRRDSCLREIKRFWQTFACGAHGNETISNAGRLLVGRRESRHETYLRLLLQNGGRLTRKWIGSGQ